MYLGTSSPPSFAGNTATNSFSPATLGTGTTYYWNVVAKNNVGSSVHSVTWSVQTSTTGHGSLSSESNLTLMHSYRLVALDTGDVYAFYATWSTGLYAPLTVSRVESPKLKLNGNQVQGGANGPLVLGPMPLWSASPNSL